jgi:uncharacterized protein (DUF3084 family)
MKGEIAVIKEQKGVRSIRTMGALVDSRRTRTAAGALLELSAIANEKLLIQKELERWTRRHGEIQTRLGEIAAKETRLMAMVQSQNVVAPPLQSAPAIGNSAGMRVKVKEFSY